MPHYGIWENYGQNLKAQNVAEGAGTFVLECLELGCSRFTYSVRHLSRNMPRRKIVEEVAAAATGVAGVDFWRLEEPTLYLILGLVALQVAGRELFSRYGPFKRDGALFAHQICSFLCIAHCALWGIYFWFTEAGTVTDRLYGATEGAVFIGRVNLAFQFYDLLSTMFIARLRKPEMLVHHTLATLMNYFLLRDCYVHFYAIFFLGISEVSSIPLVFVDVLKYFPEVSARYPDANGILRIAFAALFILLRVLYWLYIAALHVYDTYWSIKAGTVHNWGVVGFFLACNLALTLMQWYWGYLIMRAAVKMMSGKTKEKATKPKEKDAKSMEKDVKPKAS